MKIRNAISGDVLECPPPNQIGETCVILNGVEIMQVLFSDAGGGTVTLGDGRQFSAGEYFADYLMSLISPQPAAP
jgi:hypothetical protein